MAALVELLLQVVAHLVVELLVGGGGEHLFGVGGPALGFAILQRQGVRLAKLGMATRGRRVAAAVGEQLGVGELLRELLVRALDLVDQVVDHVGHVCLLCPSRGARRPRPTGGPAGRRLRPARRFLPANRVRRVRSRVARRRLLSIIPVQAERQADAGRVDHVASRFARSAAR